MDTDMDLTWTLHAAAGALGRRCEWREDQGFFFTISRSDTGDRSGGRLTRHGSYGSHAWFPGGLAWEVVLERGMVRSGGSLEDSALGLLVESWASADPVQMSCHAVGDFG
jgi:hypothetical protein